MRDLDSRSILTGDFVVVYGDVVSNLPLDKPLREHRTRRQADKNAIMTMLLREASVSHRTKAHDISPIFVIDSAKERCLHYEQLQHHGEKKYAELEPEILSQDLDVRGDLIDCGIDICTPDVLALWSDYFDIEAPRRGFLHSVLKDFDLNGKTIHTFITRDHYAARVRDLHAYDSVSKDILSRWSYPLSPELSPSATALTSFRGNVHIEEPIAVARSSKLGPQVLIGRDTKIGPNSRVSGSVLGRRVTIGQGCNIQDAYIWDDVSIGDRTEVRQSIVANGACLASTSTIIDGALISYGVNINSAETVVKGQRIFRQGKSGENANSLERNDANIASSQGQEQDGETALTNSCTLSNPTRLVSPANAGQSMFIVDGPRRRNLSLPSIQMQLRRKDMKLCYIARTAQSQKSQTRATAMRQAKVLCKMPPEVFSTHSRKVTAHQQFS